MAAAAREIQVFKIYILIAVPVILFNLVAVFGPEVLLQDDVGRYYRVVNGLFPYKFWKEGLFLCSLTAWIYYGAAPQRKIKNHRQDRVIRIKS